MNKLGNEHFRNKFQTERETKLDLGVLTKIGTMNTELAKKLGMPSVTKVIVFKEHSFYGGH
jgi:hypothetical protein